MKKLLSDYLTKWYIPVFVSFIFGFLSIFIISLPYQATFYLSLALPFIALSFSFILGIIRLFKKQYLHGTLQVGTTVALAIAGAMFMALYLMFYPYDFYADNLEIPESIHLEIPKDSFDDTFKKQTDFKLYNGMQPGIYTYDISIGKTEKGTVFLKAIEITQNDSISIDEIRMRSAIVVKQSDTVVHYRLKDDFTIYEGDWGKPYAARFEIWFSDSITGKKVKLAQKNYKIEGWMR